MEALLIDELVERLQDADSLAGWVREADEQALAAERTEGDLETTAAVLARLEGKREKVLTLFVDGDITRAEKSEKLATLDDERDKVESRATRLSRDLATAQSFAFTIEDLESMTVGSWVLDVRPGDERDVTVVGVDETGAAIEVVEGLGWLDALLDLRKEAAKVVYGRTTELPEWAAQWATAMAERLDVKAFIEDVGEDRPTIRFEAVVDLSGARSLEHAPSDGYIMP
ncbi:MAG: hypothetical protein V3U46_08615, partial [Acidimicrobiia bacterium]